VSSAPAHPGVYVPETPSGVRTIAGVPTSVVAFVGRAKRGPVDEPVTISNYGDFERIFGGLWRQSSMSYSVCHYFLNGGQTAVIVRVDNGATPATFAGRSFSLQAASPGLWGEELKNIAITLEVDPDKIKKDSRVFNISVTDGATGTVENFFNVSAVEGSTRFVGRVLEEESHLIRVLGKVPQTRPLKGILSLDANSASDGSPLTASNILGDPNTRTGIYALEKADIFNLLCIPSYNDGSSSGDLYATAYPAALKFCLDKRAVLLVDPPSNWTDKDTVMRNLDSLNLQSENAAFYFPRIRVADPLEGGKAREFVPCGAVAGVIARTDGQRGVWKAPAGIDATLAGVLGLSVGDQNVILTDGENGELNPLGVNCLRIFPAMGPIVWGARTLKGADRLASERKYLPVRRTALFIEETLYRGTQWAVFEPNDEPLWSQIRLNVGAFMHSLFTQGAFQGPTPKDAYFVKCDGETTTQDDVNKGIVNVIVGFAPLRPAEFIVLKIRQLAGRVAT